MRYGLLLRISSNKISVKIPIFRRALKEDPDREMLLPLRISFEPMDFWDPKTTHFPVTCAFLVRIIQSIAVLISASTQGKTNDGLDAQAA